MARTNITQTKLSVFKGDATAGSFAVAEVASDVTNFNSFVHTGREVVLLRNTGASARTCTVKSMPDKLGRSGDIATYSVPAGELHVLPLLTVEGWRQADGRIYLDGSNAELKMSCIVMPTQMAG